MTAVEAYPLHWPAGYPRTPLSSRERARFKSTFGAAVSDIINELRLLGATYPVVSTNQPLRRDGLPYAARNQISEPGVAIYFLWKGKQRVFACDKWDRIEDNLRAVALTVEAMRGMERWGVSQAMERSFEGFTALPAPTAAAPAKRPWNEVLGVPDWYQINQIESVYREKAKHAHPDRGGSHTKMSELNAALEEARRAKGAA